MSHELCSAKTTRRAFLVVGFLAVLTVALFVAAGIRFRQLTARGNLEQELSARLTEELGMPTTVKSARVQGWTRIEADGLSIRAPAGAMPLDAKVLSLSFDKWRLVQGELTPSTLEAQDLEVDLASEEHRRELVKTIELIDERSHRHKPRIIVAGVRARLEGASLDVDWLALEKPAGGVRGFRLEGRLKPQDLEPVTLDLRGAFGGSPAAFAGTLRAQANWLDVVLEGGIASIAGGPRFNMAARLSKLDLSALGRRSLGRGVFLEKGTVSAEVKLTGPLSSPALEGEAQVSELGLDLPRAGPAVVRSGYLAFSPSGTVAVSDVVLESSMGTFSVAGAVRSPLEDPRLDVSLRSPSIDLASLMRDLKLKGSVEGGCSANLRVRGTVSRPEVHAELMIQGTTLDWPTARFGVLPLKVVSGTVVYDGGALKSRELSLKVWGVPITADIAVEDMARAIKVSAEARARDVDVARMIHGLPPNVKKVLERYKAHGHTDITIQIAGARGNYSAIIDTEARGLEFRVPGKPRPLPLVLTAGRVTLSREVLYGHRLEGTFAGGPFIGDVAVAHVFSEPKASGDFLFRGVRLERVAPAVASRYALRGTPDVRVVLREDRVAPIVATASAKGMSLTLSLDSGTKVPLALTAGTLSLEMNTLKGKKLEGLVAQGRFTGEVTVTDPLGKPRSAGHATLRRIVPQDVMPAVARRYALEGAIDADLDFDGPHTKLACSLAGLRTRFEAGASGAAMDFQQGKLIVTDSSARLSQVKLSLGAKGGQVTLDGDATENRMALAVGARNLELKKLLEVFSGMPVTTDRRVAFDGKIASVQGLSVLTGKFTIGKAGAPDAVSGQLHWDGREFQCTGMKVAGCAATLEGSRTDEGTDLTFEMPACAVDSLFSRQPSYRGIATGDIEAVASLRTHPNRPMEGRGHVLVKNLAVNGQKVAHLAGIANPSSKLRGAGGFLSLGLLPGLLSIPGQVAAGKLNVNASYVDFAFAEHDLGNLRWEFRAKGSLLEGPVSTSPDPSHVSGRLSFDLASVVAKGELSIADKKKQISMKVHPLLLDSSKTPPVRTPDGLKNIDFAGAGDPFNFAGTAGGAALGALIKGGTMSLGPASLVPMLFMGDKKPHHPYTGKPGTQPSAAEATVLTTPPR